MSFFPKTTSRVTQSTSRHINERIRQQAERNVERYCGTDRETISRRLEELDAEWDMERTLETGASAHILLGLILGTFVNRRWYAWSAFVSTALLFYALFGWAPPLPVMRRMGIRTAAEIDEERNALRILRGDFTRTENAQQAMAQARLSAGPSIVGAGLSDTK